MTMGRYDDEIRAVEERLVREREALADQAHRLAQGTRSAVASPKGLLVAAAIGFLIGELFRPRHHHHHSAPGTSTKIGLGGLVGGVALALMRAQYGSPLGFGRAALQYAAERRRAAQASASARAAYGSAAAGAATRSGESAAPDPSVRGSGGPRTAETENIATDLRGDEDRRSVP